MIDFERTVDGSLRAVGTPEDIAETRVEIRYFDTDDTRGVLDVQVNAADVEDVTKALAGIGYHFGYVARWLD